MGLRLLELKIYDRPQDRATRQGNKTGQTESLRPEAFGVQSCPWRGQENLTQLKRRKNGLLILDNTVRSNNALDFL